MIQYLLAQIETGWRALISGQTPPPTLLLAAGKLELSQSVRDRSNAPRAQAIRQTLALRLPGTKQYTLDKTPLAGSLRAQAIGNPGQLDEWRVDLLPDDDYQIDPATPAIRLSAAGAAKAANATHLLLAYSFVGLFAIQEFKQLLHIDVRAATPGQVEQWASLLIALLLTEHDTLLATYNASTETTYSAGDFTTKHTIDGMRLLEGVPGVDGDALLRLLFQVSGRLELGKQSLPAFGLIEQVVSPGRTAAQQAVDIAVNLAHEP